MPSSPALASFHPATAPGTIVLIAQAAYHLDDLVPTVACLQAQSVPAAIACVVPSASVLRRWRTSWWRHQELLRHAAELSLPAPVPLSVDDVLRNAGAVVVRNDWGPTNVLIRAAQQAGVPTVGWVEGVQDFSDADTGRSRRPYRTVDHVLCLGDYDAQQLAGSETTIVGSHRLWMRWKGPPTAADGPSVANVNFTYGVLERARSSWTDDVLAASRTAAVAMALSRHPADRGRRGRRHESGVPVEELLSHAPRLVSRFSTLCYEALALGVGLIYHNPHGERVRTFAEPEGAFTITRDRNELAAALETPPKLPDQLRRIATPFLSHHLVLEGEPPAARAAAAIVAAAR